MEQINCRFCGNVEIIYRNGLCEKCCKKLENWDIVEYEKKLVDFEKLKTEEALKFLRKEALNQFIDLHILKDYLVETKVINDDDFKIYCTTPEEYKRKTIYPADVYLVFFEEESLNIYYKTNQISGVNPLLITKKEDFSRLKDSNITFFVAQKAIKHYEKEIMACGKNYSPKIVFSPKNRYIPKTVHIKSQNPKETKEFLKKLIEIITLPGIIPLHLHDIKMIFYLSNTLSLKKYEAKLSEKYKLLKHLKKMEYCFLIITGGTDMSLKDIKFIENKVDKMTSYNVTAATVDESMNGKISIHLYESK